MTGSRDESSSGRGARELALVQGVIVALMIGCVPALFGAEGIKDRLFLRFGGMRPGSGLGGGLEYRDREFANGLFDLRAEALVSIRLYQRYELELRKLGLGHPNVSSELLVSYRDQRRIDYYGIGRDAREEDHANFRLSGLSVLGSVVVQVSDRISVGPRVGWMQFDTGSGTNGSLPSIEEAFSPADTPGLAQQPDYLVFGGFASWDSRDDVADPTRGTFHTVQWSHYQRRGALDADDGLDNDSEALLVGRFQDLDVDSHTYVSVPGKSLIAFRFRGVFTRSDRTIPFYLMPSLGGADSLLGFDDDRFRDNSLFYANVELRRPVTLSIRLLAFADAGQVFPSLREFDPGEMEYSYGAGMLHKIGSSNFISLALGLGREGYHLTLRGDFRF